MSVATLTSKGQITLPKEVRDHFHLAEGDRLEFVIGDAGEVHVQPVTGSFRDLQGLLQKPGNSPVPADDPDAELIRELAEDNERIRRGDT